MIPEQQIANELDEHAIDGCPAARIVGPVWRLQLRWTEDDATVRLHSVADRWTSASAAVQALSLQTPEAGDVVIMCQRCDLPVVVLEEEDEDDG